MHTSVLPQRADVGAARRHAAERTSSSLLGRALGPVVTGAALSGRRAGPQRAARRQQQLHVRSEVQAPAAPPQVRRAGVRW